MHPRIRRSNFVTLTLVCVLGCLSGCSPSGYRTVRELDGRGNWINKVYKDDLKEAADQLPHLYARFKKAGFTYDSDELPKLAQVEDSDNATPYILAASNKLSMIRVREAYEDKQKLEQRLGGPGFRSVVADHYASAPDLEIIRNFQEPDMPVVLKMTDLALTKSGWDFHEPRLYAESRDEKSVLSYRELVNLYCFMAEKEARNGNGRKAADWINKSWRFSHLPASSYREFEQGTAASAQTRTLRSIERCVELLYPSASHPTHRYPTPDVSRANAIIAATSSHLVLNFGPESPGSKSSFAEFVSQLRFEETPINFRVSFLNRLSRAIRESRLLDGEDRFAPDHAIDFNAVPKTQYPTTTMGKAEVARELGFALENASAINELDLQPAEGATKIDAALVKIDPHGLSYVDLNRLAIPIDTAKLLEIARDQRQAELLLIKVLQYNLVHGKLPPTLAALPKNDSWVSRFRLFATRQYVQILYVEPSQREKTISPVFFLSDNNDKKLQVVASYPALNFTNNVDSRNNPVEAGTQRRIDWFDYASQEAALEKAPRPAAGTQSVTPRVILNP